MRTRQERAVQKQRILQVGKLRYIFLFGVLGGGFGLGLGNCHRPHDAASFCRLGLDGSDIRGTHARDLL